MRFLLAMTLIVSAAPALAGPQCTNEPVSAWVPQAEFQKKIVAAEGYQIQVFKVTAGNCYELYGRDKTGKRIEIYFHPVTAAIVKTSSR